MTLLSNPIPNGSGDVSPEHGPLRIGIDIGGTGIKATIVNKTTGEIVRPVLQVPTPQPAAPDAVGAAVRDLVSTLTDWACQPIALAPIGLAFPAIVDNGIARSAANIDPAWIGLDIENFMTQKLHREVRALNDADAAGLAETIYGAGRQASGTILVITLGTGIGSALVVNGQIVPNTEFGHLELDGVDAETRASAAARERDGIDWPEYSARLQRYFSHLEFLLSPDLIIVGGGISARSQDFLPRLKLNTPLVPAALQNTAGMIGAVVNTDAARRSAGPFTGSHY